MKNTPMKRHLFRSTQRGRINFQEVLDYFQDLPNFEIYYDKEEVDIIYTDNDFGFQYEFKITKVSQVKDIYKLNPAYLNINFMLCLPLLVPSFAIKEILNFTAKVCKFFDLSVYHESFEDVRQFSVADMYSLFQGLQMQYLDEFGCGEKIFIDQDKLNAICKYQRMIDKLIEYTHSEAEVNPCYPIIDRDNNEYGICTYFNFGNPTLFAPYFDFVNIKDEDGEFLVRREEFLKLMDKYLAKTEEYLPDMYVLKAKGAKQSKGQISKLKKCAIVDQVFETLRISDLLDKTNN